jgi:hypothetical protein
MSATKAAVIAHVRLELKPLEGIIEDETLDYFAESEVERTWDWPEAKYPADIANGALQMTLGEREADAHYTAAQREQMWNFIEGRPVSKKAFQKESLSSIVEQLNSVSSEELEELQVVIASRLAEMS